MIPVVSGDSKTMLLKPDEAMKELRISRATLWKLLGLARQGEPPEIESFLIGPNARRIPRASLEAYIARKLSAATSGDQARKATAA
jgi:predicted DNA-binding transcriptional regulator AlpA